MRTTIAVQGAREHNLKNISVEIPRDQLVVVTGVSGSGKSSLAFDTIYAEGQRRYMESLSSYARRSVEQLKKPDVDFLWGLSPVIAIEQKTVRSNPRSTVATLTDIASYINLLYATVGQAQCPFCERGDACEIPVRTVPQIVEQLMALPQGTSVELRAPLWKVYGEELSFLWTEVRRKGVTRVVVDGEVLDLREEISVDESRPHQMLAIADRFVIKKGIDKQLAVGVENALDLGERFLGVHLTDCPDASTEARFYRQWGCPRHQLVMGGLESVHFMFNDPKSACRTCLGLGTYLQPHPDLLVPDKTRSIAGGALVPEVLRFNLETYDGRTLYSLSRYLGFDLDVPWCDLPPAIVQTLLHGYGDSFEVLQPPGTKPDKQVGKTTRWDGIIPRIERTYRWHRQKQVAHSDMEQWLQKVMVEYACPDCGGSRLRPQRLLVTIGGKNLYEWGETHFSELRPWLQSLHLLGRGQSAGTQILKEIVTRLDLLLGIGLEYLSFNRRSSTLSGGESQRIRLSTQIGSGLMGMLYVLDEPSIGLHPKDTEKMIATLRRLRDLGNTVIVVEHDEETIRAADHVVEVGPGPGVHGGEIVTQGLPSEVGEGESLTGLFLSGRRRIAVPSHRRPGSGKHLTIRGARENNLRDLTVEIPLGQFITVTGASGSGKSTLVNDILYKRLHREFADSRTLSGAHDGIDGLEHLSDVLAISQSPIGRTPRSNPATYIGVYDHIRQLFAEQPAAKERGYTSARFSFNVKGGRCEECQGEGIVTQSLGFMPDVETPCETCKGARYNADTLEVLYRGKSITDVLEMSIEEAVAFFGDQPGIRRRIQVLNELGVGYLTLGQSATTLSGGEAQRIKLGFELAKMKRGGHVLYILDEPTTGLHLADIERLLECLNRLVDAGHTVLVIEHHLDIIKTADWIIDLGPEGGHKGGLIVAEGTPETVAACADSYTGRFLRPLLGKNRT